jgi:carbonic anhydrase
MTSHRTQRTFAPSVLAFALAALALPGCALANGAEPAHVAPARTVKPAVMSSSAIPPARVAPAPTDEVDPLERLRERLAEKLGATRPPEHPSPNLLRVENKPGAEPTKAAATSPAPPPRRTAGKKTEPAAGHADGHAGWGYTGPAGPQTWGGLKPEFTLCGNGKRQSPIDIRDGIAVDLEPVQFDYRASSFRVIDNGHTVQVNLAAGNFIHVGGRRWELQQFHFHRPSEERIDGRQFDMVAHLVHKDMEGRLAVVAVLLDRGSIQPIVQTVWNNLPLEKNEEVASRDTLDLNHLLPPDRRYYTYMGSLTTPPCSEGVLWMVMRQPVQVTQGQLDIFARLYPMNARPLQQAAGRLIKQSQ